MLRSAIEHPKMTGLIDDLGIKKYEAVGILETLWHFTARFAPKGDVGRFTDRQISTWLEYPDTAALINALTKNGWLDVSEKYRLVVHDWHEHADQATKKRMSRNKLRFVSVSGRKKDGVRPPSGQCPDMDSLPVPVPEPVPEPEITSSAPAKTARKERERPTGDHAEIIRHFCEAFNAKTANVYPFVGGRDGKIFKDMLELYPLAKCKELVDSYMATDDQWSKEQGLSVPLFRSQWSKLLSAPKKWWVEAEEQAKAQGVTL